MHDRTSTAERSDRKDNEHNAANHSLTSKLIDENERMSLPNEWSAPTMASSASERHLSHL
jgi:hypothetical protein